MVVVCTALRILGRLPFRRELNRGRQWRWRSWYKRLLDRK
jgi:hypothetical protein